MDIYLLLIIGHLFGTILGVGGATMIEFHLNKFLKDGKMSPEQREVMGTDFLVTRIGMVLAILTGIGFVVIYAINDQLFRLQDGVFWAKMAIVLVIVINAVLLHKHKIGLYWGSAFSFVSWWAAALFGILLTNGVKIMPADPLTSFGVVMLAYGITVVIGAKILHILRERGKIQEKLETTEKSE